MTVFVFFHWSTLVSWMTLWFILSKIFLLILPISDLDGLMSLNDGLFGKPFLWSFTVMEASDSCIFWILLSIFSLNAVNKQAKKIAEKLNINDRIKKIQESEAYITVKDHKKGFPNNPSFRLINPSKSDIGRKKDLR